MSLLLLDTGGKWQLTGLDTGYPCSWGPGSLTGLPHPLGSPTWVTVRQTGDVSLTRRVSFHAAVAKGSIA